MKINDEVQVILNAAYDEAVSRKHEFLTPEHLIYTALFFESTRDLFKKCEIDPDELKNEAYYHYIGGLQQKASTGC